MRDKFPNHLINLTGFGWILIYRQGFLKEHRAHFIYRIKQRLILIFNVNIKLSRILCALCAMCSA